MPRSLERRLSVTLAAAILVAGIAAGGASFLFAYLEAEEFQDDTLRQIAALADRQAGTHAYDGESNAADPESRVLVLRLPADPRPSWLPADLTTGFHTLAGTEEQWRVYVRTARDARRIAVAQSTGARNELAIDSALRTLAPLIVLLPLLVWLAARIVRRELGPVRQLAHTVDEQHAASVEPLPEGTFPEEIAPFMRAINRLLERVARLVGEQRRFIADAAHELRSPLTALSLQAQNLEAATTVQAMRERVAPLRAGIDRARRLTEQLLELARSQAGSVEMEPVNLSSVARELLAEFLPEAQARGIDLGMDERDTNVVVLAQRATLSLIIRNALDNAVRYTPSGGAITLRLLTEGDDALLEVADSGPGIPADERERVFQPFFRLDSVGGEGSGLGLAIARDAAARLGGVVSLDERSGGGLVFRYRQKRRAPLPAGTAGAKS